MGQEVSMDTERMDSWETVMRVVYPVKDAEQTLPLYAIDWTRPHVAETTLDSRIDMRRLEFSSMNQSTLQRMLRNAGSSNGVSCDSFEITGRTSVTLRDHGHMSGCTFFTRSLHRIGVVGWCEDRALRSVRSRKRQDQRLPVDGSRPDLSGSGADCPCCGYLGFRMRGCAYDRAHGRWLLLVRRGIARWASRYFQCDMVCSA